MSNDLTIVAAPTKDAVTELLVSGLNPHVVVLGEAGICVENDVIRKDCIQTEIDSVTKKWSTAFVAGAKLGAQCCKHQKRHFVQGFVQQGQKVHTIYEKWGDDGSRSCGVLAHCPKRRKIPKIIFAHGFYIGILVCMDALGGQPGGDQELDCLRTEILNKLKRHNGILVIPAYMSESMMGDSISPALQGFRVVLANRRLGLDAVTSFMTDARGVKDKRQQGMKHLFVWTINNTAGV